MSLFGELKDLGVNVDEGLERVMEDEPLYETMLGMFIDKADSNPLKTEDFDAESLDELIGRVHMLKGLTGNLAMTPLYEGYMKVLDLLRTNRAKEASEEYERIVPAQAAIMDCIKRYIKTA